MNKLTMIGGSGVLGLCLGLVMGGNGVNGQSLALAGLLALPPVAVGLVVADTKAQSKINQAESKASKALRTLDDVTLKLATSEQTEARLKLELVEVLQQLGRSNELLKSCQFDCSQSVESINRLESSLSVATERLGELEAEVEAWEGEFYTRIEVEAEKRFQVAKRAEIQRIQAENDEITNEALDIVRGFRQWAVEVDGRLQDRGEFIKSVTTQYNSHLEGLKGSVSTQIEEYLKQIEILNCKVAGLQQKLAGDLVETELLEVAYSVEGRIANDIAKEVFATLQIPLAVRGYHVKPDGSTDAAYGYSRSMGSVALIEALKKQSEAIAKSLRIHKITSVRKLEIADLIVLSFRREPAVKTDEIKRLLTPIDKLATMVIREMTRKSTIRIMGATGDGKGICARYLLSEIVKSHDWYIRLHDPQDGSAEDYWDIPKVSSSGAEMKKALKAISKQMIERESSKVHDPVTLDVLDEIDTQLEKDDKGQFLDLISRIRHLGMKMILIGQNPKVSRAGFQWSDMGQMIAFYQGSVALDAIKNNPALELKRDILLKQYEEISSCLEDKNQYLDDSKKHYFGLCVIPGKSPIWYELPVADGIDIQCDPLLLGKTFSISNNLLENTEGENFAKTSRNSGKNNNNLSPPAETKTLTEKGMARIDGTGKYADGAGTTDNGDNTGKATCKNHPNAELREQKDGRYYCPACKKRIAKSNVEYR